MKNTLILLALTSLGVVFGASNGNYFVYVGTYTGPQNPGIHGFRWDPAKGSLTPLGLMAATPNPSWVIVHPSGNYLYAVNEQDKGEVSAFSIDRKTGKLTLLNTLPSDGSGPCHLSFDRSGKFLAVANYSSGSITVFPLGNDGRLAQASAHIQHEGHATGPGVIPDRQEGPHAHCSVFSPDNRFLLVADLGLDEVLIYRFDPAQGTLTPNNPPFWKGHAGAGPRHLAFSPDGKYLYLVNEMGSSVDMLAFDSRGGKLKELQDILLLPPDFQGHSSGAEIQVHPSGQFVYASNRGLETISVLAVHHGSLRLVQNASTLGKEPRHFTLDPSGKYMLVENQNSNNIIVFHVDKKTGMLHPSGENVAVPSPVCIAFHAYK